MRVTENPLDTENRLTRLLNEAGRTTKRHRVMNGNVHAGRKWSKDTGLRVLRNPYFAGFMSPED